MIKVDSPEGLELAVRQLRKRIEMAWDGGKPIELLFRQWRNPRSRAQNNLYWQWLTELASHASTEEKKLNKEDMHDAMRYRYLGTEQVTVAGIEVVRLPSTTKLSRPDMAWYMGQIEAWAAESGVYLPVPEDNEYMQYREAMR